MRKKVCQEQLRKQHILVQEISALGMLCTMATLDDLIKLYFSIIFGFNSHIIVSIRTLHCSLKTLSRTESIQKKINLDVVYQELKHNGEMQGYCWLHLWAIQMGFVVQQETT